MNWHSAFIEHLGSIMKPSVYVELGVRQCETFNRMVPHAETLIGVDINAAAVDYMRVERGVLFVNASTVKYAEMLAKNPVEINMLFIDADHDRVAVIEDFNAFFPFIADQGLILLHDTFPGSERYTIQRLSGTAYRAAEELGKNSADYEMVTIPKPPGLTICRKRRSQVPW